MDMVMDENKPEGVLPIHTLDKYMEILLESVPGTQRKAMEIKVSSSYIIGSI